jgi:transposase
LDGSNEFTFEEEVFQMLKLEFSPENLEALSHWRFHHPHPHVQLKMEVVYLRSQKLENNQIQRLCGISKATFYRYLHEYQGGGVEQLKALNFHCPGSKLVEHKRTLEEYFREHPPATCAEAAARIEELTGIKRGPTQTREFLKKLGMKPRKVGQIPAKADAKEQEAFKEEKLEPRLAEAKAGKRVVFFMDAAHFVYAPFLALLWCFERLFVKAPSGRQRLNVLAALNATTQQLFTVQNLTYVTAETVCELLRLLAGTHLGMPITIVLDNARYQKCALVQELAQRLGIELLYLPAYSPNLNLIERLWKWVKKRCLYSKYYATSEDFQQAIQECIAQAHSKHQAELESLLTLEFQTFKEVPVIGEGGKVTPFPGAKQPQKKVLSKAA